MTCEQALECLAESTSDVYLNDVAYWSNVPEKVWQFTLGGSLRAQSPRDIIFPAEYTRPHS